MALLSPWSLVWLLAAAAILAVYLLKPRSRRVEVSSTWLWQGALRQESARSLIQWLKRHLLLLLQIAVALAGVFALARPALNSVLPVSRTAVIAIDASASMLANDGDPAVVSSVFRVPAGAGGAPASVTRLDEARARGIQALSQLRRGDRVVVMRLSDHAEIVAQGILPDDAGRLRQAIERLPAAPTELDLQQALDVAGSVTRTARVGEVLILTGGAAEADALVRPPVRIQLAQVGRGDADNQAITSLAARRSADGEVEVFARIRNFGDQAVDGALRLTVDGRSFGEQAVSLGPLASSELLLTDFPPTTSVVDAVFTRRDLLVLDNVATAAVAVPPVRKVLLVGGRSDQLERALKSVPGVELEKADFQKYDGRSGYDVYVFEGWFPPTPPPGHWILIDPPRGGAGVRVTDVLGRRQLQGQEVNTAQIARVLPSPLLQGVDLTGVSISEAKRVELPEWAEEAVSAREGPLMFLGYPQPYRAVVFAFDLRSSNLFGRVGFPVLIANAINWLSGELSAGNSTTLSAGANQFTPGEALLIQPLPRATHVEVDTPARRHYRFDGNKPVRFLDTERPGAYTVIQYAGRDEIARRVHVASVLAPGHEQLSDLRPRGTMRSVSTVSGPAPQVAVAGPGQEQRQNDWWRPLAALGLLVLAVEWWWFHR